MNGLKPDKVAKHGIFVLSVEADGPQVAGLMRHPGVVSVESEQHYELSTDQSSPPWGLDRIDQRNLPLNSNYSYAATGAGVVIYTIDSGLWLSHDEFTGRVAGGAFWDFGNGTGVWDCNGHGTHVAGTAAGTTYGVAKGASIVPVKALDCDGDSSSPILIGAVDWIVEDHIFGDPAVVNMSVGGPASSILDSAVQSMIDDGITVITSAGNDAVDSCLYSPARLASVITVAASTIDDDDASYSNYGSCNDLFAPGSDVLSAWAGSDSATNTISGTSMAAPHVAGAAAMVLESNPSYLPSQVWSTIDANATVGVLTECCGDPDKLLHIPPSPPSGQLLSVSKVGDGAGTVSSSPSGIDCGVSCSASYSYGTSVELFADAAPGSAFVGWSGACTGTGSCVVSMTGSKSVTASFAPPPSFTLSVSQPGSGTGTVASSPSGIYCGSTCSASFVSGTSVTLTATPAADSVFASWSGACAGSGSCVVSMTGSASVTAVFDFVYDFTVSIQGAGAGSVSSSPPGISCPSTCTAGFAPLTSVTLTAIPDPGSRFAGWIGWCTVPGLDPDEPTCVTSMNKDGAGATAFFETLPEHDLTVSIQGAGAGSVSSSPSGIECPSTCTANYWRGTSVMLTATPSPGSVFMRWQGWCSGSGPCVVSMDDPKLVTAVFDLLPTYELSVSGSGAGSGTVTSSPLGIDCQGTCAASFVSGSSVTLTVMPNPDSVFAGWSGACTGIGSCVVAMTQQRSVVAEFSQVAGVVPVVPARLLETRSGPKETTVDHLFEGIGRQGADTTLELKVTGRGGVPGDADAVILNVTAVSPDAPGFLTVFPCGGDLPLAANVNYVAGDVVPNAVLAKIGTSGKVCIYTSAETHIVADVNGYVP